MAYRLALNVGWREDLAARREALLAKIEAADRAGVDSVWVEEAWGRDAFSLLVQAAGRTERIGLATGIVNVFSRSPGALAQHFASLDELSGGRAIAGLGSSGPAVIEGLHGAPWRDPLRRTAECVRVLRALLAGEAADYGDEAPEGARGFALAFRPPRPDLPIHIATLAPRSLRQTRASPTAGSRSGRPSRPCPRWCARCASACRTAPPPRAARSRCARPAP